MDYALRLAKQAVVVSHAYDRYVHEMDVMREIVRGTPPLEDPAAPVSSVATKGSK